MLLTDSDSIRDVILFPTIEALDKPESAKRAAAGTNCAVPAAEQGPVDFSKVEIEPCSRSSWTSRPLPSPTSGP